MNLIEKLNSYTPLIESSIPNQYDFNGFNITELFDIDIYSLIIMYQGNIICNRATFRSTGCCDKYKNKRLKYIAELEAELIKLNISY